MLKRIFDVIVAAIIIVLACPLWLFIAIVIRAGSRGPVLHRASRVGRGGVPFTLYKFRTMGDGASQMGPAITRRDDARVTTVGRWLRALKIDEMPQVLNVLRGDMSIVGPRPEDPRYVAGYTTEQRRALSVRPGMASPAFIAFRHEEAILADSASFEHTYITEILPEKLRMDLAYIDERSFLRDLAIIARAFISLFTTPAPAAANTSSRRG